MFLIKYTPILLLLLLLSCDREVSVTPPDEPPPDGFVFIDSNPENAQIYLDGKNRRRSTPDSITWLETGTYKFTLKKELFLDTSITVDIVEGEKRSINIDYTSNPDMLGDLLLKSMPEGCDIYFDGEYTGYETPHLFYSLVPDYYSVTYRKPNYQEKTFVVPVKSSTLSDTSVTLIDTTVWQHYTAENSGLPSNSLSSIAVDKNNVVWIGTTGKGLAAFDGIVFNSYNVSNSDIAGNATTDITVDDNNYVWASSITGISVGSIGGFGAFASRNSPIPDSPIKSIIARIDNTSFNNTIWMTIDNALISTQNVEGVGRVWEIIGQDAGVSTTPFGEIAIDGNGVKWVTTENSGVLAFVNKRDFGYYATKNSMIPSNRVTAVAARENEIWVACSALNNSVGGGIAYFTGSDWERVVPGGGIDDKEVVEIFIDSKLRSWFATPEGVFVLTNKTEVEILDEATTGLDLTNIIGITEDNNGFMWFATQDKGIFQYKKSD